MGEHGTQTMLERLGGAEGIRRWIWRFYDRVGQDALLAPLFPAELTESRVKQAAFFLEFFGGPPEYTQRYGQAYLRFKHRRVTIGRAERDAWLAALLASLREEVTDAEVVAEVERRIGPIATSMINHDPARKDAYYFR
ncbi:MAG: globin [Candidatus Lambdaproteobacteria bacterium]|nr:globin [Candidatus Lambdaproteobacteria bacterium]